MTEEEEEKKKKKTTTAKKNTTTKKKTTTEKKTSTSKKSTTVKKKSTTTKKKTTTTSRKKTTKKKEPVKKEIVVKEPEIEETIDDIDIVFQTKKIPLQEIEELKKEIEKQEEMEIEKEEKVIEEIPEESNDDDDFEHIRSFEGRKEVVKIPKEDSKKKKKFKLSKRGIIILALLIVLIDVIFIAVVVTLSKNNNKAVNENDSVVIDLDYKDTENIEENNTTTKRNKNRNSYDLEKLNALENIDKTLDFFKYENIDRYLSYKDKNNNLDLEKVIVYVNIGLDKEFYSEINDSPLTGTNKVIANKYYKLKDNYEPSNLVFINEKYTNGSKKLVKEAAQAFEALAENASKQGLTIRATSTYRSYSYQKDLYNSYVLKDGKIAADTYSARAGHSEHQTGLAVDVDNAKVNYTEFGTTKEYNWMLENAYKYGFILRYTKNTEWITGYKDEAWHYRYVGKDIAKYINDNPMTYEEYFVRFIDK